MDTIDLGPDLWTNAEWAEMNELVTEEFCFICKRLTDHRGEHNPGDLEN